MRIFVSYSHRQGDWVWNRLVPCLRAGGAEILIDRERSMLGKGVVGQMDAVQDTADRHLLVLSPEYLASGYCKHEMKRALKKDPKFGDGRYCRFSGSSALPSPKEFKAWNAPLWADLRDDRNYRSLGRPAARLRCHRFGG